MSYPFKKDPTRWKPWFRPQDWGWFAATRPDGLKYWIVKNADTKWWLIYLEHADGQREEIGENMQRWSAEERAAVHWERHKEKMVPENSS